MVNIQELIQSMTLEEKAGLCSGADFWHTKAVERLGIPALMVSDGPHGLRKQDLAADHLGVNESIKAVCFPSGCGTAASFNRELLRDMGETLGNECQAEGVGVILGPAVNIKRSPLCGRNFEYYSEDPYLASEIAGSLIEGIQSKHVGTSIKHFLANNQEERRMSVTAQIDERTLREIYLAAFEGPVTRQKPWTLMCSYNRVNGTYVAESKTYLTDVLRGEWGFDGFVVSDWGAVNKRVEDLAAGLDLEMPSSNGANDALIVEAVQKGLLEEAVLDRAVERILTIVYRFENNRDHTAVFDRDADHEKARKVAEETIVLLKNEGVLPLSPDKKVAFIGKYAASPRYQGGGSSHINSHKVTSALDAASHMDHICYARGFDDKADRVDQALLDEAVELARESDVAVIFAGLPDSFESEGFDRTHMRMPQCQNRLIEAVAQVQPRTIVVLHNGSPVEMPWIHNVAAVLETYLGGQAVGGAVVDILFGHVNPSGKLPETFPLQLEDNPSFLNFPGEGDLVEYKEGIYVGYRYYDTKKMEVLFPFGHGLSYTSFAYSNLRLSASSIRADQPLEVLVDVTNTGSRPGKEAVQLYVSAPHTGVARPVRELRDFHKVELAPGQTKTLHFLLNSRAFAYWETRIHDWYVAGGEYTISIGASSRDIRCQAPVQVSPLAALPVHFTPDSCFGDILAHPLTREIIKPYLALPGLTPPPEEEGSAAQSAISKEMMEAMTRFMPLRGVVSFTNGRYTYADIEHLVEELNKAVGN